jgi:hypothetical protein
MSWPAPDDFEALAKGGTTVRLIQEYIQDVRERQL